MIPIYMVSIAWTGEEDPYLFLASSANDGFPMVLLGFPITPVVIFFATRKPWFPIGVIRLSAIIFF